MRSEMFFPTRFGRFMESFAGRQAGQLALFDLKGFTDPSASMSHAELRVGPSGKPWVGTDEIDAAGLELRRMVSELQTEISELDSEHQRLIREPESHPLDQGVLGISDG